MRVNLSFQPLSAYLEWGSLLPMTVDQQRKSLSTKITALSYITFDMSPAGRTDTEDNTHIGFDRRPRLPFLPMTGVPKCSGLVRGSLSSVCRGDKQQQRASVPSCQTLNWKTKDLSCIPWRKSLHGILPVTNRGVYPEQWRQFTFDKLAVIAVSGSW